MFYFITAGAHPDRVQAQHQQQRVADSGNDEDEEVGSHLL